MKEAKPAQPAHEADSTAMPARRPSRLARFKDVRLLIVGVAAVVIVLFFVFAIASMFE